MRAVLCYPFSVDDIHLLPGLFVDGGLVASQLLDYICALLGLFKAHPILVDYRFTP